MMFRAVAQFGVNHNHSTGIFAVVRTVESASALHTPPTDMSFSSILGLTWAGLERNIAIMVASVPAVRPLVEPFIKLVTRAFSYGHKSTSDPQSYEMGGSNKFQKIIDDGNRQYPTGSSVSTAKMSKESQGMNVSQDFILPIQAHEHV
jgi:hypothetical protein